MNQIFIEFLVFGHIQQTMFVVMANFIETFGQVHKVNICRQFLVTFKDFGHLHSVKLATLRYASVLSDRF